MNPVRPGCDAARSAGAYPLMMRGMSIPASPTMPRIAISRHQNLKNLLIMTSILPESVNFQVRQFLRLEFYPDFAYQTANKAVNK